MDAFRFIFTTDFGYSILRLTTPILLAALAALLTQRAGVTNLAIEGLMTFAALFGVIGSAYTGSAFLGVLSAMLASIIVSIVLAYFILELKTNLTLACISMNLLAAGATVFILFLVSGNRGVSSSLDSKSIPLITIPLIDKIPVLGPILSNQSLLTYIAFLLVILVNVLLFKMPLGLRLRAVGEMPDAASSVGISVKRYQYIALILSGALCGLAGAYMSMGNMSVFSRGMVAGRGYIAVAISNLGGQAPFGVMIASIFFAIFESLANNLQITSQIPIEIVQMIPYIMAIVLLSVSSLRQLRPIKHKKTKTKTKKA